LTAKRKMKDTNLEHITNLTLQQGWNWKVT
jgi:hypothetical protein